MDTYLWILFVLILATNEVSPQFPPFLQNQKIIDGVVTDVRAVPYQLRLSFLRIPICGATLVSRNIAFTAAHCVTFSVLPFLYSVQAGINFYSDPLGQRIHVRRIATDPRYGSNGVGNDFSILFFFRDVIYSDRVRPIRIASRLYLGGTPAVISGWGTTEDGVTSEMLRLARVKLITNQECAERFRPLNVTATIDQTMICTLKERRGTCYGDSGGPLVVGNEIVGVTSWGAARCVDRYPSVYSNVFYQLPFIRQQAPELFVNR